jgi:hypothetical protein
MPQLVIPQTVQACQLEFPEGLKRSVKGSLHIRPGTLDVTDDEWSHIQKKHPTLAASFLVSAPPPAAPVAAPDQPEDVRLIVEEPAELKPKFKHK